MKEMQAKFIRKESRIETQPFAIDKVVELSEAEYAEFRQNLLESYDFIREHTNRLSVNNGVSRCLLVLDEGGDDGILVRSEGYDCARYTSYLPNARQALLLDRHPSLEAYIQNICGLVDRYCKQAVDSQLDGESRIRYSDVKYDSSDDQFDEELFMCMMTERPEIETIDFDSDEYIVTIASDYLQTEPPLRELEKYDVDLICAKHLLWLNDAGGEQADFSGCCIRDLNLSGKNLVNAIFDGAKLVEVNLADAELCFSSFQNTRFYDCKAVSIDADEANFKGSEFIRCDFDDADFMHGNFTDARFIDCSAVDANFGNSCLDGTDFGNIDYGEIKRDNVSCDEKEWLEADSQIESNREMSE